MGKKPKALLLAANGKLAFAAGCVLLALGRHSPDLGADILLYTDGTIPDKDQAILRSLGAEIIPFENASPGADSAFLSKYTDLAFARFQCLRLLDSYERVIYLDADMAVQDDIAPLFSHGPLGVTLEDPSVVRPRAPVNAGFNLYRPVPGFNAGADNINIGVLVFHDTLPDPGGLFDMCFSWMAANAANLRLPDQAAFNFLARRLQKMDQGLVSFAPCDRFNAHFQNPGCSAAAIVHTFGPHKFWSNGLIASFFPEWRRDYLRWLNLGGSPWTGEVINAGCLDESPFVLFARLGEKLSGNPGST